MHEIHYIYIYTCVCTDIGVSRMICFIGNMVIKQWPMDVRIPYFQTTPHTAMEIRRFFPFEHDIPSGKLT